MQNGYARMAVNGQVERIDDWMEANGEQLAANHQQLPGISPELYLVIDRLSVDDAKDAISRLVDSAETAFYEGRRDATDDFAIGHHL